MYHYVCFILLVSLERLKAQNTTTVDTTLSSGLPAHASQEILSSSSAPANKVETTAIPEKNSNGFCTTQQVINEPSEQAHCLFNLSDQKEILLWSMISLLVLICLLLLVIIMCLVCKRCQGSRNNYLVVKKSSKTTRRNSANGGPSETDVMLKACSSVKVEIETTPPDERQEPEEVGGAAAESGNQVSGEENKNSASKTAPTQEVDQSGETDVKMEDLEKVE